MIDRIAHRQDRGEKLRNYGRRLLQPQYWPQLWRLARRRLVPTGTDRSSAAEAARECAKLAVDAQTALNMVRVSDATLRSLAMEYSDRFAQAQARAITAPKGMGGAADIDLLYSLCRGGNAVRVLETGVAFGWSSLAILSAIADRPDARLVSVDLPYLGSNLDHLVGAAIPDELRSRWVLYRGADRERLERAIASIRPIDIAHYDSDKSYGGRRWAYPLIWDALAPNGILVSDDIQDNLAFLDFAHEQDLEPIVVHARDGSKFSGIVQKPKR